jgi:hypothetical protein
VKEGPKNALVAISKICDSVHYTKSTPLRKHSFKEAINHINMGAQVLPSIDVPTCWNLTDGMLNSSLPYKNTFNQLLLSDANYTYCPTMEEWDKISMIQDFLAVCKEGLYLFHLLLVELNN